jgi:hypothetical protein
VRNELPMATNASAIKEFTLNYIFWSTAGGQRACSLARNGVIDSSPINLSPPASTPLFWAKTETQQHSKAVAFSWFTGRCRTGKKTALDMRDVYGN